MTDDRECERTRDVIVELAAGVAVGDERAAALNHLAGCAACRRELDATSAVVDQLVTLVPAQEPPVGFEAGVLSRIAPPRPAPRRLRRTVLRAVSLAAAAAVVAGAVTAGAMWRATADDRRLAASYRKTLAVADGRYLTAAGLYGSGLRVGHVFGYQGSPSWLFVTVEKATGSGTYDVRLVTRDGRDLDIGDMTLTDGRGSWGVTITSPVHDVARVILRRPGAPDLTAGLH